MLFLVQMFKFLINKAKIIFEMWESYIVYKFFIVSRFRLQYFCTLVVLEGYAGQSSFDLYNYHAGFPVFLMPGWGVF